MEMDFANMDEDNMTLVYVAIYNALYVCVCVNLTATYIICGTHIRVYVCY